MGLSIALVTTWKVRCGIASYSEHLANALSQLDVNVYVVRLPRFGLKDVNVFQNIVDTIPTDKIDLIHIEHEYGLFSNFEKVFFPNLKRLGKPIVTTMHAVGNWELDNIIAQASDKIIVHNDYCYKRFGYLDKVHIIPHGMTPLQTPAPPGEACKKYMHIQEEALTVGYLGYISSYKGLETLIDAMRNVPNAGLVIGGGWFVEQETAYIVGLKESTLKALPNRCQWLGYIPDDDLGMAYGAMDIIVYPSRFMTESGALLMALSHGKAVIARDLPPVREKAKQKVLLTFKNVDHLRKKIKRLLKDEDLRRELQEAAKAFSQQNSWENIAKKHIQLYEQILRDKPNT